MKPQSLFFPSTYLSFLAIALVSSSAFASLQTNQVLTYELENLNFSSSHAINPVHGNLRVNRARNAVHMEVQVAMPPCPAGRSCIQVMPSPLVVELPIQSIEKDSCGILHVVASRDARPADGIFEEIRIEDVSGNKCPTLLPLYSNAAYTTSFVAMASGQTVTHVSNMELNPAIASSKEESFEFVEGQFTAGFPALEVPQSGSLQISESAVALEINKTLNCEKNAPCPMYMPYPILVTLPVVEKTPSNCGNKLTAQLMTTMGEVLTQTEVEVWDYRNARCKKRFEHPIQVRFNEKQTYQGLTNEKTGTFFFQ